MNKPSVCGWVSHLLAMRDNSLPWLLYAYAVCYGLGQGSRALVLSAISADIFQGKHFGAIFGYFTFSIGIGGAIAYGALIMLGVSLAIAGPWYARNVAIYGSPFAIEVGFGPPEPGRWSLFVQAHAAAGTLRSFWFPMQHLADTPPVAALRALGVLLVAAHGTAALGYLARRLPFDAPTLLAGALVVLVVVGHAALNLVGGESEGRFLLPALGPLAYLFVAPVFAGAVGRMHGEPLAWLYLLALAAHPYLFLALA